MLKCLVEDYVRLVFFLFCFAFIMYYYVVSFVWGMFWDFNVISIVILSDFVGLYGYFVEGVSLFGSFLL